MIWLWVVVIVILMGAVVVVAVGRGDALGEAYDDRPDATVPTGRQLTADDLRDVRFSTGLRGYRMDEVDNLLARLRADLMAREARDAADPADSPAADEAAGEPPGPTGQHVAGPDS